MTKGSYAVGESSAQPPRRDTSFRSFICALLIFLSICLIILLASIGWGNSRAGRRGAHLAQRRRYEVEVVDRNQSELENKFERVVDYDAVSSSTKTLVAGEGTIVTNKPVFSTKDFKSTTGTSESTLKGVPKDDSGDDKKEEITTTRSQVEVQIVTSEPISTIIMTEDSENTPKLEKLTTIRSNEFLQETEENNLISSTTNVEAASATGNLNSATKSTPINTFESTTTDSTTESLKYISTISNNISFQGKEETSSTLESLTNSTSNLKYIADTSVKSLETKTTIKLSENTTSATSTSRQRAFEFTTSTSTSTTEVSVMESESATDPLLTSLSKTSTPVCTSGVCKRVASEILGKMNHSAEPCVDFYEFACGSAPEAEPVADLDAEIFENQLNAIDASSPKFVREFKLFYESCLQYENNFVYRRRMEGLEGLINSVGHFQISDSRTLDLTDLVSSLVTRQSMPLFDIAVDVDKQSAEFILQLTIPRRSFLSVGTEQWSGLHLLKKRCLQRQTSRISGSHVDLDEVYKSYRACQKNHASYLNSIENVIRDLSFFSSLDSEVLLREIKSIRFTIEFDVLNNLDELPPQEVLLTDFVRKNYVMRKISDLQLHYPIFDWKKLVQTLTGRGVSENMMIQVYFPEYFQKIFKNLLNVNRKNLNNAFLAIYAYDLFINTVVPKETKDRHSFCTDLSKKLLPDVFSYFVNKAVSSTEQNNQNMKLKGIFETLKKQFCSNLFYANWIDDNSKISIIQKCKSLNVTFYEPPNENTLEENFKNVNVTSDHQVNLLNLMTDLKRRVYSVAGTPLSGVKVFSYFLNPLSSDPKTFYASPSIVVPLGLALRVSEGLPSYLVQARVGFSLARQIARHFDPTGIRYGIKLVSTAKYAYREFTDAMETLMDDASPCIFQNKNVSFRMNGALSVNERIVDNAAFRLILDSARWTPDGDILPWISADYSREKVLFLATAQEFCHKTTVLDFMLQIFEARHLPPVLRVKNIMGNSQSFAERFSCPEGSDMVSSLQLQFPFLEYTDEGDEDQNIVDK